MQSNWRPVDGCELEYAERGNGEPLILLHGGCFADWFLPMFESGSLDRFRVIRIRRAGYCGTPLVPFSIRDHARHLAELADRLAIKQFHLLGHSFSSLIALQLAADRPNLIQTLTLLEPAPCGPFAAPAFKEIAEKYVLPAMKAFENGNIPEAFRLFLTGMCGPNHRAVIEASLGKEGFERALQECVVFFKYEVPAALSWSFNAQQAASFAGPVLIAEGEDSRAEGPLSQQVTEAALKLFPHASFALIQHSNHMMPLQQPGLISKAVLDFIKKGQPEG